MPTQTHSQLEAQQLTPKHMKTKCPYTYPCRSRKAMIDYLANHESYSGWNHPFRKYSPLSWNVKIGNVNLDGKRGEEKTTPELDEQWEAGLEGDYELYNRIVEDMQRQYVEGEYTTYLGNDQGDWVFCFAGRSGGHMLLEKWCSTDFLRSFTDADHWRGWLENGITTETLRKLYRAVACMDQDFTHDKIDREFEYQLNFQRSQWEEIAKAENAQALAEQGLEPCPTI